MRLASRLWASFFVALVGVGAGCEARPGITQLVVFVEVEPALAGRIDDVRLEATMPDGSMRSAMFPVFGSARESVGIRHVSGALGDVMLIARGREGGIERVHADITTQFVAQESRLVTLRLTADCLGVACGQGTACVAGACVSSSVPGASLPVWNGENPDAGRHDASLVDTSLVDTSLGDTSLVDAACICEANQSCGGGSCACLADFGDCDARPGCETDLSTSLAHCGDCETPCVLANADEVCMGSACQVARCEMGFEDCDGLAATGCEVSLSNTAAHCGSCGMDCNALPNVNSASCSGSACVLIASSCDVGFADCNGLAADGCEVDLTRDASHCGTCPNVCSAPSGIPSCVAGRCTIASCPSGTSDCDGNATNGCEVNTASPSTCGTCGALFDCNVRTAHATGLSCSLMPPACNYTSCESGFANCDGDRSNGCEVANRAVNSCGACGSIQDCSSIAALTNQVMPRCSMSGNCNFSGCASGYGDCTFAPGCETRLDSPTSCGSCASDCTTSVINASGVTCAMATCNYGACASNASDCDGNRANGCEHVNTNAACGCTNTLCPMPMMCVSGVCR